MKPILQAMLVADHVYEDKATGKKIVVGIFDKVLFKKGGPQAEDAGEHGEASVVKGGMHAGSPYAYLSLTDVHGPTALELRYVDLQDHAVLFKKEWEVRCEDPLVTIDFVLPMPPIPTPHSGVFALELLSNGDPVGSYRITVEEFPSEETQ